MTQNMNVTEYEGWPLAEELFGSTMGRRRFVHIKVVNRFPSLRFRFVSRRADFGDHDTDLKPSGYPTIAQCKEIMSEDRARCLRQPFRSVPA